MVHIVQLKVVLDEETHGGRNAFDVVQPCKGVAVDWSLVVGDTLPAVSAVPTGISHAAALEDSSSLKRTSDGNTDTAATTRPKKTKEA